VATIFISYRTADTAGFAGRLRDSLADRLGPDCILVRDVDSLSPGVVVDEELVRQLDACEVVLALIGKSWAAEIQRREQERQEQERRGEAGSTDYVVLELARAIAKKKFIIPVLVDGATRPTDLPADLAPLAGRKNAELHDRSWSEDVDRLVDAISLAAPVNVAGRPRRLHWLIVRLIVLSLVIVTAVKALLSLAPIDDRQDWAFVRLVEAGPVAAYLALEVLLLRRRRKQLRAAAE
jgi:hypothetical protein